VKVRSAKAPRASVMRTKKVKAPRLVGVPVIRPGLAGEQQHHHNYRQNWA
jgi:hypothetical protein